MILLFSTPAWGQVNIEICKKENWFEPDAVNKKEICFNGLLLRNRGEWFCAFDYYNNWFDGCFSKYILKPAEYYENLLDELDVIEVVSGCSCDNTTCIKICFEGQEILNEIRASLRGTDCLETCEKFGENFEESKEMCMACCLNGWEDDITCRKYFR